MNMQIIFNFLIYLFHLYFKLLRFFGLLHILFLNYITTFFYYYYLTLNMYIINFLQYHTIFI